MRYLLSFCGYFPADAPKYSCIVQIIKVGQGSGGGTSGVVFKEVAERIMAKSLRLPLSTAQDTLNEHTPLAKHGNLSAANYLLDKLDIETTNSVDDSENDRVWGKIKNEDGKISFDSRDIKENLVPDVKGMGAKDAIYLLKQAGLKPGLSGYGRVISQSIPAGQKATKGSYIQITLKP
jgi:cell division protein FtsI (penicillin-binding protein 3)